MRSSGSHTTLMAHGLCRDPASQRSPHGVVLPPAREQQLRLPRQAGTVPELTEQDLELACICGRAVGESVRQTQHAQHAEEDPEKNRHCTCCKP